MRFKNYLKKMSCCYKICESSTGLTFDYFWDYWLALVDKRHYFGTYKKHGGYYKFKTKQWYCSRSEIGKKNLKCINFHWILFLATNCLDDFLLL